MKIIPKQLPKAGWYKFSYEALATLGVILCSATPSAARRPEVRHTTVLQNYAVSNGQDGIKVAPQVQSKVRIFVGQSPSVISNQLAQWEKPSVHKQFAATGPEHRYTLKSIIWSEKRKLWKVRETSFSGKNAPSIQRSYVAENRYPKFSKSTTYHIGDYKYTGGNLGATQSVVQVIQRGPLESITSFETNANLVGNINIKPRPAGISIDAN